MRTSMQDAWAAGFFDGEGCVFISKQVRSEGKYTEYKMRVSISQKSKTPLELIKQLYGGTISPHPSGWQWQCGSQIGASFLRAIEPYLICKNDQVRLALEFQDRKDITRKIRAAKFVTERLDAAIKNEADLLRLRELKVVTI